MSKLDHTRCHSSDNTENCKSQKTLSSPKQAKGDLLERCQGAPHGRMEELGWESEQEIWLLPELLAMHHSHGGWSPSTRNVISALLLAPNTPRSRLEGGRASVLLHPWLHDSWKTLPRPLRHRSVGGASGNRKWVGLGIQK